MSPRFTARKSITLLAMLVLVAAVLGVSGGAVAQTVIKTVSIGNMPHNVAVNAVTNRIYVSVIGGVAVVDGNTDEVLTHVFDGLGTTYGIAVNPKTGRVYAADTANNTVSVIDGASNTVVNTIHLTGPNPTPGCVAVNDSTNRVYVGTTYGNSVYVIDGASDSIIATVPVGANPEGIGVNRGTNMAYVANRSDDTVSVINGATNGVVATIGVYRNPAGVGVYESTNRVFVAASGEGQLSIIDGATNTLAGNFNTGQLGTEGVCVYQGAGTVFAANSNSNNLTSMNAATERYISTVTVGEYPFGVGVNESTGKVYVANVAGDSLSVLQAQPPPPIQPTSRIWGTDSIGVTQPAATWYLAEGCTAGSYETWILVQNPNMTPADVRLTYMTPGGAVNGPAETIAPNSRKSYSVGSTLPNAWEVSTKVTCTNNTVIAERAEYWGNRREAHDSIGVSTPAATWYLAEGCTAGGFTTWILVQNPNETPADVKLTYMTSNGPMNGPAETLAPNSRKTYNVAATVPNSFSVSTKVEANALVVAERAMYGGSGPWGTDSVGVSEPASTWYLAEGCTAPTFETWVLVQNPNDTPADVKLTYMTSSGAVDGPSETLAPNTRNTYNVGSTVAGSWAVSTKVECTNNKVIAERAMYGKDRTWAHDSIGAATPANVWYLAEGSTGPGFETWVLVQNPGDVAANINITYMTSNGPVAGPSQSIPAHSRNTFNVASTVNGMSEVSTMVTSDHGVVVERAMYGDTK